LSVVSNTIYELLRKVLLSCLYQYVKELIQLTFQLI